MKADLRFASLPKSFWACIRSISQNVGYTVRGEGRIRVPSFEDMEAAFQVLDLNAKIIGEKGSLTQLGSKLIEYYGYRAEVLNGFVQPRLMDAARAKAAFEEVPACHNSARPIPMNKQKGEKKHPHISLRSSICW